MLRLFTLVSTLFCLSSASNGATSSERRMDGSLDVIPPSYISIKDIYGKEVSSIELMKYERLTAIFFKTNGTEVSWTISPELPDGLTFNSVTSILSGNPTTVLSETIFTITASNSAGRASTTLAISVNDCPYGEFYFPRVYDYSCMFLEIYNKDTVFFSDIVNSASVHRTPLCLPRGELSYYVNCTSTKSLCILQLEDESHRLYFMESLKLNGSAKGSFVSTVTKPPAIHFRPVVAAYYGEIVTSVVLVDGIHTGLSIEPELPEVELDPIFGVLSLNASLYGLTSFTLSAKNDLGETRLPFTLAVDECPTDTFLLQLSRKEVTSYDVVELYNADAILEYDLKLVEDNTLSNLCIKPDEEYYWYFKPATHTTSSWRESNALYLSYNNAVLAQFNRPKYAESEIRHFQVSLPLPLSSSLLYSYEAGYKWKTMKYDDRNWKSGITGEWGSFSASVSTVFFRHVFVVANPSKYSHIHLTLLNGERVNVYINEIHVLSAEAGDHSVTHILPAFSLNSGKNIVAVEMKNDRPEVPHKIVFDMSIFIVTSDCLLTSENGSAYSEEPGVENAFDLDPSTFWSIHTYPATARYTFKEQSKHVVNKVMMQFHKDDWPVSFRVEGIDGNNTVTLFTLTQNSSYPMSNIHYFHFMNNVAFPTYQVVFEESFHSNLEVNILRFLSCSPSVCKRVGDVLDNFIDATAILKCPIGTVGTRKMTCQNIDNQALWDDSIVACLPKHPKKGVHFIDWTVAFFNVTSYYDLYVLPSFKQMLADILKIELEDVYFNFIQDLSTPMMNSIRIDLRLTVDERKSKVVMGGILGLAEQFNDLIPKYITHIKNVSGMSVADPILRKPISIALLVTISISVIIVVSLLYICLQHKKTTSLEKTPLLSDV